MTEARVGSWGRSALVNTAAAFVLAAMVNSLVHELAHAVAGLVQGLTPTVTPFSVDYRPQATRGQGIVTALAGPFWSLAMGLVLLAVARSWGTGFVRLFWLWLAFMGVMNFAGYLLIAPFARAGDTARALTLLGAPGWVFLLAAVVGVALQFGLAYLFARQVSRYTDGITDERVLALRAWGIGTGVVILLTVAQLLMVAPPPEAIVAVVAYSFAVGIFAPMQFIFRGRGPRPVKEDLGLDRVSRAGVGVTAAVAVALLVLAAVRGLTPGRVTDFSIEANRRRYARLARAYDVMSGEPVYRAGRRLGIDALGLRPGQCVLDVGCGTGLNFAHLVERVGAYGLVIGVDASAAMLGQARRRTVRAGWENVRLLEADATTLDLVRVRKEAGGPIDAALATYALSLMPDWPEAWRRMFSLVRPGGRLVVVDMQPPTGPAALLTPVARLAGALGGADLDAHPWTGLEADCTEVVHRSARGGHLQVRAGSKPG